MIRLADLRYQVHPNVSNISKRVFECAAQNESQISYIFIRRLSTNIVHLTFRRRNFLLNFSTPVFKM
jgi:hypothetical protein